MGKLFLASTVAAALAVPSAVGFAAGQPQVDKNMRSNPAQQSEAQKSPSGSGAVQVPKGWDGARQFGQSDYRKLAGRAVQNAQGEPVGEIEDLVTGPDGETHAVLAVGERLALGEKRVVVRMEHLRFDRQNAVLLSPEAEAQLEQLPDYDQNRGDFEPLGFERGQDSTGAFTGASGEPARGGTR